MIRILVVDDSVAVRGLLRKIISAQSNMEVVGAAIDGKQAVDLFRTLKPDIVIMDIEMPELNGIQSLSKILEIDKTANIIMCSSLTQRGAVETFKALELGARDFIPKPSAALMFSSPDEFNRMLIEKILGVSRAREKSGAGIQAGMMASANISKDTGPPNYTLRSLPPLFQKADVIAIGSSTGGVEALFTVLKSLAGRLNVPVFITQHMPAAFTRMLAIHIKDKVGIPAYEAVEGMIVEPGNVYIAPGDRHLDVQRRGDKVTLHLSQDPPENYCRPAVDPMYRSILATYQKNILCVILTGMGNDGLIGSKLMIDNGNLLIAQDEASSVVWGMPGAVAKAGICHAVLPLDQIGPKILMYLR